jgi:hypothetical protein
MHPHAYCCSKVNEPKTIFKLFSPNNNLSHCQHGCIGSLPACDVARSIADDKELIECGSKLGLCPSFGDWAKHIAIPIIIGKCANTEAVPETMCAKFHLGASLEIPGEQPYDAAVLGTSIE